MHQFERSQLASDLRICRILNGMWQVSGAHGRIEPEAAIREMLTYHNGGFTTWDLADHYGPAEDFIAEFRSNLASAEGQDGLNNVQALTKWVPRPGPMPREVVESNIDISLRRMQVDTLDLLQFHWWDYRDSGYLDALSHMFDMVNEGKIRHLALTNFDTEHTKIILDQGIKLVSNQVQYSLIDRRPEIKMVPLCKERGIGLLTYGTLCGGLISEKYLGRPEPSRGELNTASLGKYKQMVDAWGGWNLLQELLKVLKSIADTHDVSIPNVATRYVLDRPAVAGVIIGVRLGLTDHMKDNARVFGLKLTEQDRSRIEQVLADGRDLYDRIGDCGDEYRR